MLDLIRNMNLATIYREAEITRALSAGDADNVFVACYSTGAAVRRWNWDYGEFMEELSVTPGHIRTERLDTGGLPILLDHVQGVRNTFGVVEKHWIESGKAFVQFRMETGTPEAEAVLNKLRQGIVRNVSVGYRIHALVERKDQDKIPTLTATDWEPFEISLVSVPADVQATTVRSDGDASAYPCHLILNRTPLPTGESNMKPAITPTTENLEVTPVVETRAVTPAAPAPVDVSAVVTRALEEDRKRGFAIREMGARHSIDAVAIEKMVADGVSETDAGLRMLNMLAERSASTQTQSTIRINHSYDDPAVIRSALVDAYAFKVSPGKRPEGKAQDFIGRSYLEGYAELCQARGERVEFSREKMAERALHTTSDFPLILADATHRVVANDYAAAPVTYTQIASAIQFTDFRPHYVLRTGEFPALESLGEGGEIKSKSIGDGSQEVAQLDTKAVMLGISRNLLINDSLGAVTGILAKYGRRIAAQENKAVWDFLGSNPKLLSDGTVLFHANHKNLYGSAVASPDHATLSAIRSMLRKHETDGIPHNFTMKTLYVDPDLETDAEKLAASILAAVTGEVNVFSGKFQVIVEPNISSHNAWYAATSVADAPTLVYGRLNGADSPMVDAKEGWNRMGMELRVVSDFGIGIQGEKGIVKVRKS